jgi:hypothetical protein
MTSMHRIASRLVARLRRPSPERFAAAAAPYDPELLIELRRARR